MTCPPSNVSPFCRSAFAGSAFGSNRRSNVILVYSCLSEECSEAEVIAAAPVSATSQSCGASGLRLDSYLHDCALPLPAIVTVTFSHQGWLAMSVSLGSLFAVAVAGARALGAVVFGVVTAATEAPAAEASMRAAITRNTIVLLRARRSDGIIAAAT